MKRKSMLLMAAWMMLAFCSPLMIEQAAAQQYVPGEGYVAEEEWYDAGDWFDGNDWEYEQEPYYGDDLYADRNNGGRDDYAYDFDSPDYAEDATYGDLYNDEDGTYEDAGDAYYDNYYTSDWYDESGFGDWYDAY